MIRYNVTPTLERTEFVGYGPKVDKAWDHIASDVGDQMITREELDRLGLDPTSLTIKNPKTGRVGYRVGMQVFHQLHCLNLLRQHSFKDYYSDKGGDIDVEPRELREHLGKYQQIYHHALVLTWYRSLHRIFAHELDVRERHWSVYLQALRWTRDSLA